MLRNEATAITESLSADQPVNPLHRHIEGHAAQQPDAIAVTFQREQFTYEELNLRANQLAHYLISLGVGAETRIAVCLKPSLDIATSLLAILKSGGVYVPLDPTDPSERLATILRDSQPEVLLTESSLLHGLPAQPAPQVFCFDQDWSEAQRFPADNPDASLDLEQTAYIVYTSGTTGMPKGVVASHGNLAHYILSACDRYGFNRGDIMPAIARFTFSITFFELLSPLVAGGRLHILERHQILDFKRMAQLLEEVTVIHASPSLWRRLLAYLQENRLDHHRFEQLRHVSSGGDTVPAGLMETMKRVFPNAEIFVIYGCSEMSCMGCTYPVPMDRTVTRNWVGQPFTDVGVRLLDQDRNPVSIGNAGEIYFGGPGVTKGYLNRVELTQEKFVTIDGQRLYQTGDRGRFDPDGNLEIFGRVDFQIQLRGIRIEPGEIEAHLRESPGVREAVVVARRLGNNNEKSLIAYLVLEKTRKQEIDPIRQFLQARLPDYMVPSAFVLLQRMPVNSNQKIDRKALPAPTAENLAGLSQTVSPRNEVESQLVNIWEKTLGIHPIGIRNNFLELGGDSLQAVQILLQIEERWSKSLPITILLEANTIEMLAAIVRSSEKTADLTKSDRCPGVVPLGLGRAGHKPPLFCVHGVLVYQPIAQYFGADHPVYGVFLQEEVELIKTGAHDPIHSAFSSVPGIASRYIQSIRSVQPHGPYYLAGYSFGGLIAFEMAHQLQEAKEEVALVAMFDSRVTRPVPLGRRLKILGKILLEKGVVYAFKRVQRRLTVACQKMALRGHRVRSLAGVTSQTINAKVQEEIWDGVQNEAAQSYVPRLYSGKVVLFRAQQRSPFGENSPDLGWKSHVKEDLDIYDVPGDHMGILQGPYLPQRLQNYLA